MLKFWYDTTWYRLLNIYAQYLLAAQNQT